MKVCVERTGGLVVLADTFSQSVFKESLLRVFRKHADEVPKDGGHLQMAFNASLEVGRVETCHTKQHTYMSTHPFTPSSPSTHYHCPASQVLTSREFKVAGAIGPCSSLRKMSNNVAETAIGEGGTNAWSIGGACGLLCAGCGVCADLLWLDVLLTLSSHPPPPHYITSGIDPSVTMAVYFEVRAKTANTTQCNACMLTHISLSSHQPTNQPSHPYR